MNKSDSKNYVVAKESDGTVQITFTIDWDTISKNQSKALEELGKDIEVPGFRKGNAPPDKVKQNVSNEKLVEKTLSGILPKMLSDALVSEKIKPSIFPKFELEKANEGEDWQVRAILCEIQPFKLGEYKTKIKDLLSQPKIWTPGSGKPEEKNEELKRSEKEQKIIELILGSIELTVPT